jgi:hypothetical protein
VTLTLNAANGLIQVKATVQRVRNGACVDRKSYYIASPEGDARKPICEPQEEGPCQTIYRILKLTALKGLEYLNGQALGGITKEDLIKGYVRTHIDDNKVNKGNVADPNNRQIIDDLLNIDVTTPGHIHIPVCSSERAFQSWDTNDKGSSANYPGDNPPSRRYREGDGRIVESNGDV